MIAAPDQPLPYRDAAELYWTAGWRGVLPLPFGRKASPPTGWTGRGAPYPSRADVESWREVEPSGNLALRLPTFVLGVDVDSYGDKQGRHTIIDAQAGEWGTLPETWRSTSRDDGVSGIGLFRIPIGLAWPGEIGPGVELITHAHRYVVAWPSMHPEGRQYRWIDPDGLTVINAVPDPATLPELPAAWVDGLTRGVMADERVKAELSDMAASSWLVTYGSGEPCPLVVDAVDHFVKRRLSGTSSRHDAARDATARLCHMAVDGHRGVVAAIDQIHDAFRAAFAIEQPGRGFDQHEWERLFIGAIRLAALDTSGAPPQRDPCQVTVLVEPNATTAASAQAEAAARALANEVAIQRLRRDARRVLDDEDARSSFRVPPSTFTLADELAIPDDDVRYRVADVLPIDANVLLTASFKAGKTTMINHLARCLVDGESFLGRFDVTATTGRVALLNFEVGRDQYRRWLREAKIANVDQVSVLNLRGFTIALATNGGMSYLVDWLTARQIGVLVVDPFARAFGGVNENDNSEVGRFLDRLDEIKSRAHVGELVVVTHTGREIAEVGAERARGATRLDDWPDARWMLTRDAEGARYFSAMGRDVEVEEFQLDYSTHDRQLRASGKAGRTVVGDVIMENRVLAIIETNPGIGVRELRNALHIGDPALGKITSALVGQHRIRITDGARGARNHWLTGPSVLIKEDDD